MGRPLAERLLALDLKSGASLRTIVQDHYWIADHAYNERKPQHALQHVEMAKQLARKIPDNLMLGRCFSLAGKIHNFAGEVSQGAQNWLGAKAAFESCGKNTEAQKELAKALAELASCELDMGSFSSGIIHAEKAVLLCSILEPGVKDLRPLYVLQIARSESCAALATLYERIGRPKLALKYYAQACREIRGTFIERSPIWYPKMASILASLGDDRQARQYFERALGYSTVSFGDVWIYVSGRIDYARFLASHGDLAAARELLDKAVARLSSKEDSTDIAHYVMAQFERGRLANMENDSTLALAALDRCRALLARISQPYLAWQIMAERARTLVKLGRQMDAAAEYERAIQVLEGWLRGMPDTAGAPAVTPEAMWAPFQEAIVLYADRGDSERVFRLSEQMKTGLLDLIIRPEVQVRTYTRAELAQQDIVSAKVQALQNKLFQRPLNKSEESRLRDLSDQSYSLRLASDARAALRIQRSATSSVLRSLGDARKIAARTDSVILDYIMTPGAPLVIVITKEQSRVIRLKVATGDIEKYVGYLNDSLERQNSGPWRSAVARWLYDALIRPVAPFISRRKVLCIVPDGCLWNIPFEALSPDGGSRYLALDYSIAVSPSIAALRVFSARAVSSRKAAAWRVVAFGRPSGGPAGAGSQRGLGYRNPRAEEIDALPRTFPGSRTLTGARASAASVSLALKDPNVDVVHLGVEGSYSPSMPAFSAMRLANGSVLDALSLAQSRCIGKLVVLAACETARGQVVRGQGLVGMPWAAIAAGARACIATRWRVDDEATARLFVLFYGYCKSGYSLPQAMQRAKVDMIRDPRFAHPTMWAGVMLWGM
jgi:CHAT domain-containing protein